MATQQLTLQQVNFSLDTVSPLLISIPVLDTTGAPINITSGWTISTFGYLPVDQPNTYAPDAVFSPNYTPTFLNGSLEIAFANGAGNAIMPESLNNNWLIAL